MYRRRCDELHYEVFNGEGIDASLGRWQSSMSKQRVSKFWWASHVINLIYCPLSKVSMFSVPDFHSRSCALRSNFQLWFVDILSDKAAPLSCAMLSSSSARNVAKRTVRSHVILTNNARRRAVAAPRCRSVFFSSSTSTVSRGDGGGQIKISYVLRTLMVFGLGATAWGLWVLFL